MSLKHEKLTFPGAFGVALAARLERPTDAVRAYAVFAHCFTCGKDIRAASTITRTLAHEGIGVLRFDFTGVGSSEGDFANTTFSSNVADLAAAARYLESEHGPARLMIGHSLGGAAVLAAAAKLPAVVAFATIGAPFEATHVQRLLTGDLEKIEREGEAVVSIAGRAFRIRREFLEDLRETNSRRAIAGLDRPLMLFHGPRDTVVSVDNARRIFEAARHPKSFVSLDDADHLLSRPADAAYVARILAAWATRYLCKRADCDGAPAPARGRHAARARGGGRRARDCAAPGLGGCTPSARARRTGLARARRGVRGALLAVLRRAVPSRVLPRDPVADQLPHRDVRGRRVGAAAGGRCRRSRARRVGAEPARHATGADRGAIGRVLPAHERRQRRRAGAVRLRTGARGLQRSRAARADAPAGAGRPRGRADRTPAAARGVEDSLVFLRSGDPLVYLGSLGYWAFDNAVLWVCFRALGHPPAIAVIATAYLIGQLGGALPLPAGIGGVDFGLIGTLVLFHVPAASAAAAVLSYRAIQLSVPVVMGGISLSGLRSTLTVDEPPALDPAG